MNFSWMCENICIKKQRVKLKQKYLHLTYTFHLTYKDKGGKYDNLVMKNVK